MAQEIEAKFRLTDPERTRALLRELGAVLAGRAAELNSIFDTPDGRLGSADRGLRIRTCRETPSNTAPGHQPGPALLTYKGPREGGRLKTRSEWETAVADPDVVAGILAELGFQVVVVYEKRRETWRLGECEVTLDELPRLGWWLEIEGPHAAAIDEARAQLGLQDEPLVDQTYVEMAAQHGHADASGCRRLLFAEQRGQCGNAGAAG